MSKVVKTVCVAISVFLIAMAGQASVTYGTGFGEAAKEACPTAKVVLSFKNNGTFINWPPEGLSDGTITKNIKVNTNGIFAHIENEHCDFYIEVRRTLK